MSTELVEFIMAGGETARFHTVPTIRQQTVGAHSFGVAWWCYLLTHGDATAGLLMAALMHDLAEHRTGDVPAPVKRDQHIRTAFEVLEVAALADVGLAMPDLSVYELSVLKAADALEGMSYCLRERRMGNKNMDTSFRNWRRYLTEIDLPTATLFAINLENSYAIA